MVALLSVEVVDAARAVALARIRRMAIENWKSGMLVNKLFGLGNQISILRSDGGRARTENKGGEDGRRSRERRGERWSDKD